MKAGIDDWGGISPVTADHVNPEPWPHLDMMHEVTEAAGFELIPRLTAHRVRDESVVDRSTCPTPRGSIG